MPLVFYIADDDFDNNESLRPADITDEDLYEERCDYCGGKVWSTGGQSHYSNGFDCYTLFLECENCGPYDVECI